VLDHVGQRDGVEAARFECCVVQIRNQKGAFTEAPASAFCCARVRFHAGGFPAEVPHALEKPAGTASHIQ
jgi:hypothetical protein